MTRQHSPKNAKDEKPHVVVKRPGTDPETRAAQALMAAKIKAKLKQERSQQAQEEFVRRFETRSEPLKYRATLNNGPREPWQVDTSTQALRIESHSPNMRRHTPHRNKKHRERARPFAGPHCGPVHVAGQRALVLCVEHALAEPERIRRRSDS